MTTWATVEDVLDVTAIDITMTPEFLAQALGIVELHAGVLQSAEVFPRDLEWLKRAVAWQAVWLKGQPGVTERSSVSSVSQDGLSATYSGPAPVVLAPLAVRALKNLSWMGTRSVLPRPRSATGTGRWGLNNFDHVDPPDEHWTPMGTEG